MSTAMGNLWLTAGESSAEAAEGKDFDMHQLVLLYEFRRNAVVPMMPQGTSIATNITFASQKGEPVLG